MGAVTKPSEIVDAGKLRPLLDEQSFTLAEVGNVHDRLASGQAMGKLVVEL